jgi:hypothetical protein
MNGSEAVRQMNRTDQFLMPSDSEPVRHSRYEIADRPQLRFRASVTPPTGRQ